MSKTPVSISKDFRYPESMDYTLLKRESIDHAQQLSGENWTDYNEHDPGVTILEVLCYTLTELGYKANFDVEKILFARSDQPFDIQKNVLLEASAIMPCNPNTVKDYRRLIIGGGYPHVKNAWVEPKPQTDLGLNLKGLYRVLLQVDHPGPKEEVTAKIKSLLNAHRNLGEDFDEVAVLQAEKITISANVNIGAEYIGESVLAGIWFALSEALSPQIPFSAIEDLQEKGMPLETIFEGPSLRYGFIRPEDLERTELSKMRTISRSHLIKVISTAEGVSAVVDFTIRQGGKEVRSEYFQIGANSFPELDIENSHIRIFVGDLLYEPDPNTTRYILQSLRNKNVQVLRELEPFSRVPGLQSDLKLEDLEYYYSLQHTFPRIFGIGEFGLPSKVTAARRAYAKQLKGYLLIFEQFLANFLSQLVRIKELFSIEPDLEKTYFSQVPSTVPGLDQLIGLPEEAFKKELENLVAHFDPVLDRRVRFLDQMLARYGEEFMAESLKAIDRQAGVQSEEEYLKKSIRSRIKFLSNLAEISRSRSRGWDYSLSPSDPDNASGLKKKIALYFNIEHYGHRLLAGLAKDEKMSLARQKKGAEGKKEPSSKGSAFTFSSGDPEIRSLILLYGVDRNNYTIRKKKDKEYAVRFKNPKTGEESEVFQGNSAEQCEEAISGLMEYLKSVNSQSEGFHLIEHILLRPMEKGKFRLYLSLNDMKLLTSSETFDDPESGKPSFSKTLLAYGQKAENYSIRENKGELIIELKGEKGKVVAFHADLRVKKTAEKLIQEMVDFLKKNNKENLLAPFLKGEIVLKEEEKVRNDPYSLQISFVLPNWTARFQNKKIQRLFEQIVKIHSPAHLSVRFFWIGLDDMMAFEKIYQPWLELKASPDPDLARLDRLSFDLLNQLLDFQQRQN